MPMVATSDNYKTEVKTKIKCYIKPYTAYKSHSQQSGSVTNKTIIS